jgi:hypothetical protein
VNSLLGLRELGSYLLLLEDLAGVLGEDEGNLFLFDVLLKLRVIVHVVVKI